MKIGILSRGRTLYSTQRLAEAGRKRKHDVRIFHPLKCAFGFDERLTVSHDGLRIDSLDVVIPRMGATANAYGLNLVRQFELMGVATVNGFDAVQNSRDKFLTGQLLTAAGVPAPPTMTTRDPNALPAIVAGLGGPPVVIKMNSGTQGVGVIVADSLEAAQSTVQAMWSLNQEVAVQKFVRESSGRDLRVFVVDGRVVGAMRRVAQEGEFRSNLHRGGSAEPVELDDATREVALRAVEVLGLQVAGVDVLESERGPLVIEINSSPGLQGIETTTGRDIAREIIACAEGMVGASKT